MTRFNNSIFLLILIILLGSWLRFVSVYPANTIIGFDQARDLFLTSEIYENHDLKIIGPTAGNNPNLHHGILYIYYLAPSLFFFHGNIMAAVYWNTFINLLTVIVVYLLGKDLFGKRSGLFAALLVSVSYFYIQFSGWLSNPGPTLFTIPLFFYGLWRTYLNKKYGLLIIAVGLALSIQFELFFVYLIPVGILTWFLLKIPLPKIKDLIFPAAIALIILSTMIATEIKFKFNGVLAILGSGNYVGGIREGFIDTLNKFLSKYFEVFSLNIYPANLKIGIFLAVGIFGFLIFNLVKNIHLKKQKDVFIFLLIYLMSPGIMLFLGFHNAPWFLIGLPGAVCLVTGILLSKINPFLAITIAAVIIFSNISVVYNSVGKGQILLEPDPSAFLSTQLDVLDYTYKETKEQPFMINSVTNPLYINAIWGYLYKYYGKERFGYVPTWGGGDQLAPYNTLDKETGSEGSIFLIMDQTPRIGESFRQDAYLWAEQKAVQVSEKDFDPPDSETSGWRVVKFEK